MNQGELLSQGTRSRVYRRGSSDVVKVFDKGISQEEIEREATGARIAREAGLPVPVVRDVIEIQGSPAIVYERVPGQPMDEYVAENPGIMQELATRMAQLHQEVHKIKAPGGLPKVREELEQRIRRLEALSEPLKEHALKTLETLPDGDVLLHCDLHPQNILVDDDSELHLIGWSNISSGHPWADVMRSYLIIHLSRTSLPRNMLWLPEGFKTFYLETYLNNDDDLVPGVMEWMPAVAVARMGEGFAQEQAEIRKVVGGQSQF